MSASDLKYLPQLLSRFSHDLRTPLNVIAGWTHLLRQENIDGEQRRQAAAAIGRAAATQTALLDEFVDLVRLALDVHQLQCTPWVMQELVDRVLVNVRALSAAQYVVIDPCRYQTNARINADGRRLQSALAKLYGCVVSAVPEGAHISSVVDGAGERLILRIVGKSTDGELIDCTVFDRSGDVAAMSLLTEHHGGAMRMSCTTSEVTVDIELPAELQPEDARNPSIASAARHT